MSSSSPLSNYVAGNGEDLITIADSGGGGGVGVAFAERRWASLETFLDGFVEAYSGGGEVLDNARLRLWPLVVR